MLGTLSLDRRLHRYRDSCVIYTAVKRSSFLRLRRAAGTFLDPLGLNTPNPASANRMDLELLRSDRWWTASPCVYAPYNRGRFRRHWEGLVLSEGFRSLEYESSQIRNYP